MPSTIPLTQDVLESIQRHLGKATADMYARFYSGKDEKRVLASYQEILREVVGIAKANEEINLLKKKHRMMSV